MIIRGSEAHWTRRFLVQSPKGRSTERARRSSPRPPSSSPPTEQSATRASVGPVRWSLTCRKKLAHVETSPGLGIPPSFRQTMVISKYKTTRRSPKHANLWMWSCIVLVELITQSEQLIDFVFLLSNRETRAQTIILRAQAIDLFPTRRKAIFGLLGLEHAIAEPNSQHSASVLDSPSQERSQVRSGSSSGKQGPPPFPTDELWKCRVCASPPEDNQKARDHS